ncbi:uncharacterized protein N7515_008742 [Penicillium bovifimosum]|uniref:Uncharacterized protein n=1 Tax=Penicillium bovifimosum TaxID=126998 RepID=A0A9W9KXS1_9EURO|nr:uncharacterized protein N7515_008742 [Penicillium bovifimosum]KAJ5124917.1 hypothetical protein N7515_008742 [Penicillium bovifimosum]
MSYFKTEYQRFLDSPRSAKLADDVSLIYVPTTTKFEQADNVITHVLKNAKVVKTKSQQIIGAIEGSDSLCLDMETTLEFTEGGGVYLPHLDDNFLADRVATFPTIHIVHFDAHQQIKQIRIYWDQGSLLKQVEVIGARGRQWPIRDGKDQTRLLRNAETARATPSQLASPQTTLPTRSSSPGKRRIRDPYAAESLTELLSPSKETAEIERRAAEAAARPASSSSGKRYTKDPYGAGSLTEILSPTKQAPAPVAPFAPSSGRPATRNFSDIFVRDDDVPDSPSKPQRRAPRTIEEEEKPAKPAVGPVDEDRSFYKTHAGKFSHFEVGADNSEREVKNESRHAQHYHKAHWEFGDFSTPDKASRSTHGPRGREELNVSKLRRDVDHHFELNDDKEDDGRIIGSFQGRGQRLYENRLFDDEGQPKLSDREQKDEPLAITGNAANRKKNFVSQFEIVDDSPVPTKENTQPMPKHDKAVKMMESQWDNYDESPEPKRTATAQRNPGHNQPSWHHGDE